MMNETAASTATPSSPAAKSMDEIVALCKRRGFVYPASEIYGGINGFWDYGPLGVQLKNNIRDHWWKRLVECPPLGQSGEPLQIVGLDSAIIQNPATWVASGHVGGFSDPMQTCRQCKKLYRADHVWEMLQESPWASALMAVLSASGWGDRVTFDVNKATDWAKKKGKKLAPGLALVRDPAAMAAGLTDRLETGADGTSSVVEMLKSVATEPAAAGLQTPCPNCGGDLTEPREFNLMFESFVGAVKDDASKVYLRPETAQGIFLNYKSVLDTTRVKVPFGIAQIGKAFRNEVTPRNFVFRSREFEQMEMEWFCHPDEAPQWYEFWKDERMKWWLSLGIEPGGLRFRDHQSDELSHYSKMCVDIEYRYPFTAPGFGELEGIAHRGCFDLTQHQEHAKQKMEYFDPDRNQRYIPNVIEPASGLTRGTLVLICEAFTPTPDRAGSKYILRFKPQFAPIKAGIFPLIGKENMPEIAQRLYMDLREKFTCQFDVKQSIGKRYARMDEAGTPYCFTIDGQTLTDQTVTVRERDTAAQQRIGIDKVEAFLAEHLHAG
jgi:glycyl-tRNA synthetase